MPEAHESAQTSKVILNAAARRGDLVGDMLTDAANESGNRLAIGNMVAGASFGGRVRRCFSVVGIAATSTAATALAAGTPTPATGFALFVLLLGGLSLVSLGVLGGASGRG